MIFPGSIFGADSVVPGVHSAKAMRKSRGSLSKELYYALFGSRVSTLADGTRQLVNEGVTGKDRIKHLINDDFSGGVNDWVTEGHVLVDNSEEALTLTSGEGTSKYWQNYVSQNNIKLEGKAGVEYVVEIEHLSGRRFVVVLDGAVSWTARYTPAVGSLKFSFITENTQNLRMRVYLDTNLPNIVGTIDNIKLYKKSDLAKHGTLHSGHGAYFNGVDNYIVVPQSGSSITEFTMLASVSGFSAGLGIRHIAHFGSRKNQLASGLAVQNSGYVINHTWGNVNESSTVYIGDGGDYSLGLVVSGSDQYLYANGALGESKQIDIDVALTNAVIGSRLAALLGEYALGNIKDVYLIPQALTAEEIQSHYNNPEQTLYWENGTLKSAFLPQATIDAMQAGEGFWYPLSGNESTGGYERNHALAMPISNGDFSGDYSDWVTVNGATILNGVAVFRKDGEYSSISYQKPTIAGEAYVIDVEISKASEGGYLQENGTWDLFGDTVGHHRSIWVSDGNPLHLYANDYSTITDMELASVKVYPLADSGLVPMQNWNTTNVTNALGVSTSTVTESYTVDEFGMQKDWPDAKPVITGELYGDGRSYVDMNDMVISGDFEIDMYIDLSAGRENNGRNILDLGGFVIGHNMNRDIIGRGRGLADNYQAFYAGYFPPPEKYILSFQVTATTIRTFNTIFGDRDLSTTYGHSNLKPMVITKRLYDEISESTGTLQITQGTRTDEQRAKDIQKLATKHGVII